MPMHPMPGAAMPMHPHAGMRMAGHRNMRCVRVRHADRAGHHWTTWRCTPRMGMRPMMHPMPMPAHPMPPRR